LERYTFDFDYVRRLREADPATQRHFTLYFGELLDLKLRARLRSPQLREEARQETFLRVLLALRRDGLESPERLGAYVNTVCNNVVFELYRSEGRAQSMPESGWEPYDERADVEGGLVSEQTKQMVREVLTLLQEKDRELLRQVFLDERDKDDVCRAFNVDREYLRVLLHRAKSRFREALKVRAKARGAS
jgi:RNA polymerase sigma-70 factor, ECF subfamily